MRDLPPGVNRGGWDVGEGNEGIEVVVVVILGQIAPERVGNGEGESAGGGEDEAGHAEMGSELVGPGEEEIGDDGDGRGRVGLDPGLEDGVVETVHTGDGGDEPVLFRVGELRGREEEVLEERRVGLKQRLEQGKVGGGDQNGDVYPARNQAFGEVEEGDDVAGGGEWVSQDMGVSEFGAHFGRLG